MFTILLPRPLGAIFARGRNDRVEPRSGKVLSSSVSPGSRESGLASSVVDPATTLPPQDLIAGRPATEVIIALQAGNVDRAREALTAIYETYFDQLWRFAYRRVRSTETAKELVQDLFLTLWAGRAGLAIHGDLKVYLYTAIRNRAFKAVRHTTVVERMETAAKAGAEEYLAVSSTMDPAAALDEAETQTILTTLLVSVSPRDRDVLTMRWFDRMTYSDIATALGVSISQVRTILARNEARLLAAFDRA